MPHIFFAQWINILPDSSRQSYLSKAFQLKSIDKYVMAIGYFIIEERDVKFLFYSTPGANLTLPLVETNIICTRIS